MKLKRIGYFNEVEDLKMFANSTADEIVYGKKGNFFSVDDEYIYDSDEDLLFEIVLEFTKDGKFAVHSDLPIDLNLLGQPNVCDFFIDVYEVIGEDEDEVETKLETKVFYCFPDFVEEFRANMTFDECKDMVKKYKGEIYSLDDFEFAYNNDMVISDLGFIKFFKV